MAGALDSGRRVPPLWRSAASVAVVALALVLSAVAAAAGELEDFDARSGTVSPTAEQLATVSKIGAVARWNDYGTPTSLTKYGGYLATGLRGPDAATVARDWLAANKTLFRLSSTSDLALVSDAVLPGSRGHAVNFRQQFGGLAAGEDGLVTVGVVGSQKDGWKVAHASSSLTGDASLSGNTALSAPEAWAKAAADVGHGTTLVAIGKAKEDRGWSVFRVDGLVQPQRARLVALPTPREGVRRAYETLFVDVADGHSEAFQHFVDAETGKVLVRRSIAHQSHPAADTFSGTMPPADAVCDADKGPWTVADGEAVKSVAVSVEATLTTNDSVLYLVRDGEIVASQDTVFSPEALVYEPPDGGAGTYHARVCDYSDGAGWDAPATYSGQIVFNAAAGSDAASPYPPKWKVFPAYPLLGGQVYPWDYPSTDTRELWCWESSVGTPPVALPECEREVANLASRVPWDYHPRTGAPTFTTVGNNARTAESWTSPLTPGPTGYRPVSAEREYVYPWTNAWFESDCNTPFVPGASHDVSAATTNLFVMHNRMHDWAYYLGFTERRWNAQDSNFGTGGTADGDPILGDVQAGAASGGFPSYLGRDNANMVSLPDGVPPITNMYLWQPLAGAFYAPCVDGDYDMAVVGHEYGHLIENRMIGKGGTRGGHHAGAMGESHGDLMAMEYLNENGFVPVAGENPYAVGAYVTGNKKRAIRNYGMNFPRTGAFPTPGVSPDVNPLNFSDMGYDITGPQVHADGEIWSSVNFDIRQALAQKYNASFPAGNAQLQRDCADGRRPADQCPGNRRWAQIMFDAFLLMPTAPSMLDARDAYLAADMMRFGGANQTELWLAFARRGFGEFAATTNSAAESDTHPKPDFESPLHTEGTVTFKAVGADDKATVANARIYVGHYEARVSPVADTNPATSAGGAGANNLDDVARFVPGTYDFVAHAPGYGHTRFSVTVGTGAKTVTIQMPTNWASSAKGAVATGDGVNHGRLIDETEATNWQRTGATPDVRGSRVTVALAGGARTFNRVQVSAMLEPGANRFVALRQFEIWACTASATNAGCADANVGSRRSTRAPRTPSPASTRGRSRRSSSSGASTCRGRRRRTCRFASPRTSARATRRSRASRTPIR